MGMQEYSERVTSKDCARFLSILVLIRNRTRMTEEVRDESTMCTNGPSCQCGKPHAEEGTEGEPKGPMVNEDIALAFLLALMPLVVLTFFGQAGLI